MIKNSAVYLSSTLINKAVPFILLPFLTRHLTPSEYGTIAIIQVFLSIFVALYGGLGINISRKYYTLKPKRFNTYVSAILFVLFSSFVVLTALSIAYFVAGYTLFGVEKSWYLAMPFVACMAVANTLNLTMLRVEEKPGEYFIWEVSNGALNLMLTVLLVLTLNLGWEGRAYGIIVPVFVYGVLGLVVLIRRGLFRRTKFFQDVKDVTYITCSLVPHTLAALVIVLSDRLIIQHTLGDGAVGIYTIGYQFGSALILVSTAFLKAWQPWFFKIVSRNSKDGLISISRYLLAYIVSFAAVSALYLATIKILLQYIVDDRYLDAWFVLSPIVVASMIYGIYQIFFPFLVHLKRLRVLALITPAGAIANVILNIYLIPMYGIRGAAYATLAAYSITCAISVFVVINEVSVPWSLIFKKTKIEI